MDISTIFSLFKDLISLIFSGILWKLIDNNLNNLNIPEDFKSFKEEYKKDLDKILKNRLKNSSQVLDDIIENSVISSLDEKHIYQVLELHSSFFIHFDEYRTFFNFKTEIKEYYSSMNELDKKIKNLFIGLFAISVVIFVMLILFNYDLLIYILISLFICIVFEIIHSWYDYKSYVSKIDNKINIITTTCMKIPNNFGEDIEN